MNPRSTTTHLNHSLIAFLVKQTNRYQTGTLHCDTLLLFMFTCINRRATRNEEKSLNSETFGYSNPRGSRSRGRNQNYSGYQGYYGGYQGGRGYRRGGQYNASRSSNPRGRNRATQVSLNATEL